MGIEIMLNQIIIMYFLMTFGYFMIKKEFLNEEGSKQISSILLKIVTPVVIINSFNIEFSLAKLQELLLTFLLALLFLGVGFIIARVLLGKENRLEQFAAAFPNVGFFGIPLVQGLLGSEALFYVSVIIVAYNIYSWTYGVYLVSGRRDFINLKVLLTNPASIGLWVGLAIFFSPWTLPNGLSESLTMVANLNTPLAMFVLGSYIAESSLSEIFKSKMPYKACAIKQIIIPIVIIFVLKLVPNTLESLKNVLMITLSTPAGVSMAMFAQQYKMDFAYGARMISLSTLLSIITIPLILFIANMVW